MTTVKIGDEQRPLQVTPRVLSLWMQESGKGFEELSNLQMGDLETLIYHALRSGYRAENKGRFPEWTRETFQDWMDGAQGFKAMKVIQDELGQAMEAMGADGEEAGNPTPAEAKS